MFGKLKRKLKGVVVSKFLAYLIKLIAEGKLGAAPAKLYWWLAGYKTYIGAALAFVYAGLLKAVEYGCVPCAEYAEWAKWLAAFFVTIGIADGLLRQSAPRRQPF